MSDLLDLLNYARERGRLDGRTYYEVCLILEAEDTNGRPEGLRIHCAASAWPTSPAARLIDAETRIARLEAELATLRARQAVALALEVPAPAPAEQAAPARAARAEPVPAWNPCPHCRKADFLSQRARTQHVRLCSQNPDRKPAGWAVKNAVEATRPETAIAPITAPAAAPNLNGKEHADARPLP